MASGMILAAGFGTRLRPLTDELPKPLVWLGDRPLLDHAADRLAAAGLEPRVVNTHHLADSLRDAAARLGLRVVHEGAILGTAGGVANARGALGGGEVVVWNGDLDAELDVVALLASHVATGAVATLAIAPRPAGEGTVGLDAAGQIVRLRRESFGPEAGGGDYVGALVLGPAIRDVLPAEGCLVGDALLPALRRGERVGSFRHEGSWRDLGTVTAYLAANLAWLARRGEPAFVAAGASVAPGVSLELAVIGAGATVIGAGSLRRVVVWPGATARAPLEDAIVTIRGVVPASVEV